MHKLKSALLMVFTLTLGHIYWPCLSFINKKYDICFINYRV